MSAPSEASPSAVEAPAGDADLLEIEHARIEFGGRAVLHDVDLRVERGEILGLVGQNGSGKSTVTKILAGIYRPSRGTRVRVNGTELVLPIVPRSLLEHRIAFVHQDLGLVEGRSVVENIAISRIPRTRVLRRIRRGEQRRDVTAVLEQLGAELSLDASVSSLTPAERTIVAIARAIFTQDGRPGLLVLDEATGSLPLTSLTIVHDIVRRVARGGGSVLMISHNLEEILALTDRVTVLRDGRVVASRVPTHTVTERDVARLMLGGSGDFEVVKAVAAATGPAIEVRGLVGGHVRGMDLELRPGTVVGVTGLEGSGFEQIPYLLTGASRASSGTLRLSGRELALRRLSVRASIREGFVLVPERRPVEGLALDQPVRENVVLPRISAKSRRWRIDRRWESAESERLVREFDVRPPHPQLPVGRLSGGNQQKVLLAKWFSCQPRVVALHEPTQAVDVGARADILRAVRAMAEAGAAVVMASLDVHDLTAVCDHVLVLRDGAVVAELDGTDPHAIIHAVYGGDLQDPLENRTDQ